MSTALILGGAECVWADAAAALQLFTPDAFICINDMIPRWPGRIDYVATLHPEKLDGWIRARSKLRRNLNFSVFAHKFVGPLVHHKLQASKGSSGLFAVDVAMHERFDGIVLCGVPMNTDKHFLRDKPWTGYMGYRDHWLMKLDLIRPRTRSMSGWTRKRLGPPTIEWLAALGAAQPDHNVVRLLEIGNAEA